MAAPFGPPPSAAITCTLPSGVTRDSVRRSISTRMTEPSGIAIGPSGKRSPDAICTNAGVTVVMVVVVLRPRSAAILELRCAARRRPDWAGFRIADPPADDTPRRRSRASGQPGELPPLGEAHARDDLDCRPGGAHDRRLPLVEILPARQAEEGIGVADDDPVGPAGGHRGEQA